MTFEMVWVAMACCLGLAARSAAKHRPEWHLHVSMLFWMTISTLVIRLIFWEPMQTKGPSMMPVLPQGSVVMINKQAYGWNLPWVGLRSVPVSPKTRDIVAFRHHDDVYIKRVHALPHDEVTFIPSKGWFVNGAWVAPSSRHSMAWVQHDSAFVSHGDHFDATVPQGSMFVVGDNHLHSTDSRDIGWVSLSSLIGEVTKVSS